MRLSDRAAAWIRTMWPVLLGYLAAWLLTQSWSAGILDVLAQLGITVTEVEVTAALGVVLAAAVYGAGGWLERRAGDGRWPALARAVGRFLLSLGLPTGRPVYVASGERVRVLGDDGTIRPAR